MRPSRFSFDRTSSLRVVPTDVLHRRGDHARQHGVDPDVVPPVGAGEVDGEPELAGLRGAVGRVGGARVADAGHRADVDDRAAASLDEGRDGVLAGEERAQEVDVQDLGVVLDRRLGEGEVPGDGGVVDQDVEAAEPRDGVGDHRLAVGFAGDVGRERTEPCRRWRQAWPPPAPGPGPPGAPRRPRGRGRWRWPGRSPRPAHPPRSPPRSRSRPCRRLDLPRSAPPARRQLRISAACCSIDVPAKNDGLNEP